jgi:hypothetical protein
MDFAHKDVVESRIRRNGTLLDALAQYQQFALMLAQKYRDPVAETIAQNILMTQQGQGGASVAPSAGGSQQAGISSQDPSQKENGVVTKARARAESSAQPNA